MLLDTLKLVFAQKDMTVCRAWAFSQKHGLILLWNPDTDSTVLPAPMNAEQCLAFVTAWLASAEAKTVEKSGWDGACDHDGSDSTGWRVYCDDWGHVAGFHGAICAIKPVILWHGK